MRSNLSMFPRRPKGWRDLQLLICNAFNEMGCLAEQPKTTQTARGKVEFDVFIQDERIIPGSRYAIECKHWKTNDVSQAVVHAFFASVQNAGIHRGFIVTTADYQKGAKATSQFTNIELLTLGEFNDIFFPHWNEARYQTLHEHYSRLASHLGLSDSLVNTESGPNENRWSFLTQFAFKYARGLPDISDPIPTPGGHKTAKNISKFYAMAIAACKQKEKELQK